MKSGVKETKKDINIDINIENNLMSKNKQTLPKNDASKKAPENIQHKYVYNPELPREVNEYYGIMASKRLYESSASPNPIHLQQYFQPPVNPTAVAPTGTTAVAPTSVSSVSSTPPPVAPITVPAPMSSLYGPPSPSTTSTGFPHISTSMSHHPSLPAVSEIVPVDPHDDPHDDQPDDVTADNAEEFSLMPEPHVSTQEDPDFGEIQQTAGYEILTPEQDQTYKQKLTPVEKGNRKRMINDIMNIGKPLRVKKATIRQWKLGNYIMEHRPDKWEAILSGTYPY